MTRLPSLRRSARIDEGFTLVEAVVSMVIIGVLATGIIAATNMVTRLTADNQSRQIAINLAERQLDIDRGILDPFKISAFGVGSPDPVATPAIVEPVSGRDYSISQATSLVGVDGADISCGSGKTIYYRRITVTVDWTGRLATTNTVQSDTIISPNGRINDAATGSIAVQVTGAYGIGESGVDVTIAPYSGTATTLQSQPAATNVDGCSYAVGVYPGVYKVTINRTGSVDLAQASSSSSLVQVLAGATAPGTFSYDQAGTIPVTYPAGAVLPTTMPVTFLNAGQPYISPSNAAAPTSVALYPYPAGYTAIAGPAVDASGKPACAAESPANWPLGTYGGKVLNASAQSPTGAASPGGTSTTAMAVPMGVFTVRVPALTSTTYLTAVAQDSGANGQPGCKSAPTFTFSKLTANSTMTLALPYGTYKLYTGSALGSVANVLGSTLGVTPVTDRVSGLLSAFDPTLGTLTLDPRSAS